MSRTAQKGSQALSGRPEVIQSLIEVLHHDFKSDLNSAVLMLPSESSVLRLRVDAQICTASLDSTAPDRTQRGSIYLGSIVLERSQLERYLGEQTTRLMSPEDSIPCISDAQNDISIATSQYDQGTSASYCRNTNSSTASRLGGRPITQSHPQQNEDSHHEKRRKTVGGLRIGSNTSGLKGLDTIAAASPTCSATTRRLQINPRGFPQRKRGGFDIHELQPSSVDRFVVGIWKNVFNTIELTPTSFEYSHVNAPRISNDIDREDFRAISSLCLKVSEMSRCSRSLEIIIQAQWVECFEARVKGIGIAKSSLSTTEAKMYALREACAILEWSEKELRNKLSEHGWLTPTRAVWRGYKEIKDAGGWVCLVFAGPGLYRTCKYRIGFTKELITKLGRLQPSLEVAADTIHPNWRKLLRVIGQESEVVYYGHPHDWVVRDNGQPIHLASTYAQWDPNFEFRHIEDSELDERVWGNDDPRCISSTRIAYCNDCGLVQSNNLVSNECRCFPELYGSCKPPCAVQIFRTSLGKNNGLVARADFRRGTAIGEFVGLITKGMDGIDVMQGGDVENPYQIYQGRIGNYTRFINHSCAPNSQFQKFHWLGCERIILVSRGIEASTEITVDYSDKYWEGLDKECLCGENCCRYIKR